MTYQPHEQRVIAERDELNEKLTKLNPFLVSETFAGLPKEDQLLLLSQSQVMANYVAILDARIARFSASEASA